MKAVVEGADGGLRDAVRLVVYVTDMFRYRPMVNRIQEELWGGGAYPPRTIVEVDRPGVMKMKVRHASPFPRQIIWPAAIVHAVR